MWGEPLWLAPRTTRVRATNVNSPRRQSLELLLVFAAVAALDLLFIFSSLPRPEFGDEWRYLLTADNLLNGFFSPRDRVFLVHGPGYPATLAPFIKGGWLDGARYLNAVWHAGAVTYAWALMRPQLSWPRTAAIVALLAFYPPLAGHLPLLYTETFSFFLMTAWMYHGIHGVTSVKHRIAAGIYLAVMILAKVAFGSVLIAFVALLAGAWAFVARLRRNAVLRAYLVQGALALLLCIPYLAYTYDLTGRFPYWSSAGANNFYWLTSPFPEEWGDWYHQGWVYSDPMLSEHHKDIFDRTTGLGDNPGLSEEDQLFNISTPEASDVFFAQGVQNVREHPLKFARNWAGNIVRFFLDVPVSVRGTPFWNIYSVTHLPMLAFTLGVGVYAWRRRAWLAAEWVPVLLFGLLVLAAYSMVSSMARFAIPLVPLWWLVTCRWLLDARRSTDPR
jgi:hypothetical protein